MIHRVPAEYRLPFWGGFDPELRRSFTASSGLGALLVLLVLLTPVRENKVVEVSQVPERFARLILEKPKPPAHAAHPERPAGGVTEAARPEPAAPAAPAPPVARPPARRQTAPTPTPGAGETGRRVAQQQVTASLAGATRSADEAVESLTAVLGAKPVTGDARPSRRRKGVGSARGSSDLAAVGGGTSGVSGGADLASSAVHSGGVQVEGVTWSTEGGGAGGSGAAGGSGSPGGSGSSGGSAGGAAALSERTQASLLAVVRRYAPGIQFCYDNELKHSPGLRGKLVAAITVTAAGKVQDARIVTDTLKSADLSSCVRSQILDWKFPAVPEGTVTFEAPFVFTPPRS